MNQRQYTLTILPEGVELKGYAGDSIYTLLQLAGLVSEQEQQAEKFCLERGSVSPADDPEAEAAVFNAAQRTEGWFLASQRHISGDAVLRHGEQTGEEPSLYDPISAGYGLAFDLGAGTVAAGLVNLQNMNIPRICACPNSQLRLAAQREARQSLARSAAGRAQLRGALIEDMRYLITKLSARTGVSLDQITVLTCAGSCLMLDLLAPVAGDSFQLRCFSCAELGLSLLEPQVQAYLLPAAGSELGADIVSSCLAADLLRKMEQPKATLLVDLGMGGEIIGAGRGRMVATSVSELPFDGHGIHYGMPASTGAIIRVEIGKRVVVKTVRDGRPQGIAGAGLLSAARAMLDAGLLDGEGRICPPAGSEAPGAANFRSGINGRELVLSPADHNFPQDILINQDDILALQMAKGSVYAACQAVLHALGCGSEEIEEILIAEAYQAHLRPRDLLQLGMIPALPPEQAVAIGNAAWQGAFLCLSNRHCLEEASLAAQTIQSLDLTTDPIYAAEFIQGMHFGPQGQTPAPAAKSRRLLGGERL